MLKLGSKIPCIRYFLPIKSHSKPQGNTVRALMHSLLPIYLSAVICGSHDDPSPIGVPVFLRSCSPQAVSSYSGLLLFPLLMSLSPLPENTPSSECHPALQCRLPSPPQVAGAHRTVVLLPTTVPPPRCLSHFLAAALPLQLSAAHCWNHFLANTLSFPALWPFLVCTWQPLKSARTPPLPCGCSCIGCCISAPLPALSSCFTVQACCRIRLVKKPDFGFIVSVLHLIITESCHLEVLEFDVYIESLLFPSSFLFLLFSLVPGFGCFVSSLFLWSVFSPANARGKPR